MDWRHIYQMENNPPTSLRFVRFGVWVKPNGAPQFTGDRPATGWEGICIMHKDGGRMKWNGGGHHATYRYNKVAQPRHKTEKPLELAIKLIEQFTNPGDTILDPFMGSGTTLEAAKLTGRKAIGIELEQRWCDVAIERVAQQCMVFV
jgi:site-specific DNA-methyltransferase (adenine-specific)